MLVGLCISIFGFLVPISEVTRRPGNDKQPSQEEYPCESPSNVIRQSKEDDKKRRRCLETVLIVLLSFVECFDFSIGAVLSGKPNRPRDLRPLITYSSIDFFAAVKYQFSTHYRPDLFETFRLVDNVCCSLDAPPE